MIRKMIICSVSLVLFFVFCSVSEAKSLKKGEVYRSLNGTDTIEIISSSELEILEIFKDMGIIVSRDTIVAEYNFKGDKLRVVYTVEGTKKVRYFLLTEEGLKDEKRKETRLRFKDKFTEKGDGTVSDNETGLMWTMDGNITGKNMSWNDAF